MKDVLYDYFANTTGQLTLTHVVANFAMALALGLIIYLSYRFSHSGAVYSARFNVSLVKLTLVTTLVMNVIGNNIALSLGMVGALSIVRFRTAIKDPRDTTYIFWCIAVGICCGVSDYMTASVGTGIIFLFMLVFGAVKSNDRYLIVIHADMTAQAEVEQHMLVIYKGKAVMRVKNTTPEKVEYIYELSSKMLDSARKRGIAITDSLYEINNVHAVNIVCQNEEVSR